MAKPSKDGRYKQKEPGGYKGGGGRVETNHDECPLCGGDIGGEGLGNHLQRDCIVTCITTESDGNCENEDD